MIALVVFFIMCIIAAVMLAVLYISSDRRDDE